MPKHFNSDGNSLNVSEKNKVKIENDIIEFFHKNILMITSFQFLKSKPVFMFLLNFILNFMTVTLMASPKNKLRFRILEFVF